MAYQDPLSTAVAKTPEQLYSEAQAKAPGSSTGIGSLDPTISSSSLTPQTPITLPTPATPSNNAQNLLGGVNAMLGINADTLTPKTDGSTSSLDALMASLSTPTPSGSDTYNADYLASGIAGKQDTANTDAAAYQAATDKYNALNAQLKQYEYNASTLIPVQQQKDAQGRGITEGGLAPIQAAALRDNALAAAPVQFNALIAQAEQATALGKANLSAGILKQAQDQLDTVYKIHMDDATAQYNAKKDALSSIYSYLTAQEKTKADALTKANDQAFTTQQNNLNQAQTFAQTAIASGQPDIAGKLIALDPKSATYQADVARLAGQIKPNTLDQQYKALQIQKLKQDISGTGSGLLSVTEAQALGVPYGTTQAQAVSLGKTPQKQATAAQETTALYANRIEQSNAIISNLDDKIATMNPVQFAAYQKTPQVLNFLKSADFQSVDQAQRNFVNAVLRRESGAVISPQEFDNARQQYFTMPGDTPATIAQKKANRDLVQQGFVSGAGQAYTPLTTSTNTVKSNGQEYTVGQVYQDASGAKWVIDAQGNWKKQ